MVYHRSSLDATFAALVAPARRAILARLERGERTIAELASRFTMTLPAVSKHVRVLERAGLATIRRDGRARRVRLRAEPLREANELLERYRVFWSHQLDGLEAYLTAGAASRKAAPGTAAMRDDRAPQRRAARKRNHPAHGRKT